MTRDTARAGRSTAVLRVFSPPPAIAGLKLVWNGPIGAGGVLLDWSVEPPPVDDGVPPEVARVVARALCAVATVTGCTPRVPARVGASWGPAPGGRAIRLGGGGWLARPRSFPLLATRDPAEAARFFDEEEFVWASEAQVLFLSPPGTVPQLTRDLVAAAFRRPAGVAPDALRDASVYGIVAPGVDGDVAGLYVLEDRERRAVLDALAAEARAAGARWEERDGAEYGTPSTSAHSGRA